MEPSNPNKKLLPPFWLLMILSSLLCRVVVEATESVVKNAPFCDKKHNDAISEVQCRKNRAGNLYCDDRSKCNIQDLLKANQTKTLVHPPSGTPVDVLVCDDDDAARRIGMTCDSFPYYNGGYPMMGKLRWDSEWEYYTCTSTSRHTQETTHYGVCMEWSSHEDAVDEYELGTYTCDLIMETDEGYKYCKSWSSVQKETKKCDEGYGCSPNCDFPTFCPQRCCGDSGCYDCSYHPHTEYEYSTGECHNVTSKGVCLSWTQEEYDEHNYHFREYEQYTCTDLSVNEMYCRRWVGEIDSEEEFELTTCVCLDEDLNQTSFCSQWTCYETGLSYFYPNLLWALMSILGSLPPILVFVSNFMRYGTTTISDTWWPNYLVFAAGLYTLMMMGLLLSPIFFAMFGPFLLIFVLVMWTTSHSKWFWGQALLMFLWFGGLTISSAFLGGVTIVVITVVTCAVFAGICAAQVTGALDVLSWIDSCCVRKGGTCTAKVTDKIDIPSWIDSCCLKKQGTTGVTAPDPNNDGSCARVWDYWDNGWQPYASAAQDEIEKSYQIFLKNNLQSTVDIKSGRWTYTIDFHSMEQTNKNHSRHTQRVIRRRGVLGLCAIDFST